MLGHHSGNLARFKFIPCRRASEIVYVHRELHLFEFDEYDSSVGCIFFNFRDRCHFSESLRAPGHYVIFVHGFD